MSEFLKQQVLRVDYVITEQFRIPVNIDLNDKDVVKNYYVIWNKLIINFTDGTVKEIQPEYNVPENYDWKRPNGDCEIKEVDVIEDEEDVTEDKEDVIEETDGGELTGDTCDACGAQRRTNYDWALRNDETFLKSFCRPCGKKFDVGELIY